MNKAVMYGAGNIGRGFIGQLFSQSGYEVAFIDINTAVIDRLNKDRCYPVRIVQDGKANEIIINNVRGVDASNSESVAAEIASADIMATAVGVNVLPGIVKPISAGLRKRWKAGNYSPLNIIICENLLDANHYLEKLMKLELDASEQELFDRTIGLVEASIGRMVPVMTPEMQEGNLLRVYVEEYSELPVDKAAFKGEIPAVKNMVPFAPFNFYIQRKLFMHNMGHATTAYLGFLQKYDYVWQACGNSTIKLIAQRALIESATAMSEEHGVPLRMLLEHADDLLYRFSNRLLGDTIERVGKDPVRKLSEKDRLIGAAELCLKRGVFPVYISLGIAAGYIFSPLCDEAAQKIQDLIRSTGIVGAMSEFSKIQDTSPIFKIVMDFYNLLSEGKSLEDILIHAEILKRQKR